MVWLKGASIGAFVTISGDAFLWAITTKNETPFRD